MEPHGELDNEMVKRSSSVNNEPLNITTLNELQIWLSGRFDLIGQTQDTLNSEVGKLRTTVHDISNKVSPLIMMDVPTVLKSHAGELEKFEKYITGQKAVYVAIGIAGAAIGTFLTIVLEAWKVIHPA